eukprot:jgi/Ulvmu1/12139/UM085_0003.1
MVKFKKQGFRGRFLQQFVALLKKNALVAWRNKRSTLLRILSPSIFILLVLLLDYAIRADVNSSEEFRELRTPTRNSVNEIPKCEADIYIKPPCFDFIYSPANSQRITDIVNAIRLNNGRVISEDRVQGFESIDAANAWLFENPESTGGGLHFNETSATTIDFVLQMNSTVKFFRGKAQNAVDFIGMPLQVAAHREISRVLAADAQTPLDSFDIGWKIFPHPVKTEDSTIGTLMSLFLFISFLFGFVNVMTALIGERETKVTQALTTIGMMRSSYWLSWVVWEVLLAFVVALISMAFGAAVQIDFFLKNNFGNVFLTLFLFQLAMVGFAYFLASFVRKSSLAISLGFVIFLVGFVFSLVINFGVPYTDKYYTKWGGVVTIVFSIFPWSPFAKAIKDLGDATINSSDPGINWAQRDSYCSDDPDCRMALPLTWGIMILHFFAYSIMAVYLSAVLPDASGVRDPPHFFLMPSYWRPRMYKTATINTTQQQAPGVQQVDEDVAAEATKMRDRLAANGGRISQTGAANGSTHHSNGGSASAIEVYGLQRSFGHGSSTFWAVCDSWFEIPKQQLFCLLGPNGAGKSTTINMLTGQLPASGGDAVMLRESVRSPGGMGEIRGNMGVCPQFDVLWNELTAREHMILFANIKGIATTEEIINEADTLISEVRLTYAANQRAGSFSGGMKRRLSVALALLGDPGMVFLDEPTTGMDPVSRRQVWDIIERAKQNRAIVLTTHSMEEADILGDRIAIMARGSMRCIGSSIRLKQRFGAGYQVAIAVKDIEGEAPAVAQQRAQAVKHFIHEGFGFEPITENNAYITYLIGHTDEQRLPELLRALESNTESLGIADTQIALTSLEEVFLNIAKQAEIESSGDKLMPVEVNAGRKLMVPIGQERVTDPADNISYTLTWGQDPNGGLCVASVQPITPMPPAAGVTPA